MRGALQYRTPWLIATVCAAATVALLTWEAALDPVLRPQKLGSALWLTPPLAFAGVLLLWIRPWLGALLVVLGSSLIVGARGSESAAWLPPILVAFYVLGRRAPAWQGWLLIAVALTLSGLSGHDSMAVAVASAAYGLVLFTVVWGFGRAVRRRAGRAARARAEAGELAAQDPEVRADRVVAAERRRLGTDLLTVVRESVTAMREDALQARRTLDPADIGRIQVRGAAAVADMRRLLGLLRQEAAPAGATPPGTAVARAARRVRRWPDALAGLMLGVGMVIDIALTQPGALERPMLLSPVVLVVVGVALRRHRPVLACLLLAAVAASTLLPGALNLFVVGFLIALALVGWSVGSRGGWMRWLGLAVTLSGILAGTAATDPGNAAIMVAVPAAAAASGRAWSLRAGEQEAAEQQARQRQAELDAAVAAAVAAERGRVARELHDVTSHALGVMVLQAGAAEATVASDPAVAREALDRVVTNGEVALVELERLGAAFAPPGEDPPPEPLATRIAGLVTRMQDADLAITAEVEVSPADPEVAHIAYRVVQEGLTNAARYAPGSVVDVRITAAKSGIGVAVENTAPTGTPAGAGSGFGLAGAAERVRAHGGSLVAEPSPTGGFRLSALIPDRAGSAEPAVEFGIDGRGGLGDGQRTEQDAEHEPVSGRGQGMAGRDGVHR